jgi:hypothetical protein
MWDTWVFEPGVTPVELGIRTDAIAIAEGLAVSYVELDGTDSPPEFSEFFDYYFQQQVAFVQHLGTLDAVDADLLALIDQDLNLTSATNPEVKNEWFVLGIKTGYQAVLTPAYEWVGAQGRSAYVRPIFTALADSGRCDVVAAWFEDYRNFYNSYVATRVEQTVNECGGMETPGDDVTPPPSSAPVLWLLSSWSAFLAMLVGIAPLIAA